MAIIHKSHALYRSADNVEAMYEGGRHGAPALDEGAKADVTDTPRSCSTQPTPTSPQHLFDNLLDDPEYDQISDIDEIEKDRLVHIRDPKTVRRRAMAADFSEGRLETFVGSPQKELPGTPNQYVSYLVTTKVYLFLQLDYLSMVRV
jgi:sorting nexin-4